MAKSSKSAKNAHAAPNEALDCVCDPKAEPGSQAADCCPESSGSAIASKPVTNQLETIAAKSVADALGKPKKRRPRRKKKKASPQTFGQSSNDKLLIGGGIALVYLLLKPRQPQLTYRAHRLPVPPPEPVKSYSDATDVFVE
ncbi:MAG: hypothetical protein AAF741_02925 [Bacteroidota bacterium]